MEYKEVLVIFVLFLFCNYLIVEQNYNYAEHLSDNQVIINDNLQLIRGSLACEDLVHINENVTGQYFSNSDQIRLYIKGYEYNDVYEDFLHEWGHHVWYEDLDREVREDWCNQSFAENVSDYANTNCEENFAETYVYWKLDKQLPELQSEWFKENIEHENT